MCYRPFAKPHSNLCSSFSKATALECLSWEVIFTHCVRHVFFFYSEIQGGIWRVNFLIDTLASEEAAVIAKLQELKNSEDFADNLREAREHQGTSATQFCGYRRLYQFGFCRDVLIRFAPSWAGAHTSWR